MRTAPFRKSFPKNIRLSGRDLGPSGSRQMFHRDDEVLTALALKVILLHVVGQRYAQSHGAGE
jgi:hypothetical protein